MIKIYRAKGFWARCYGWHSFRHTHPQQWLFLPRCQAVHSLGLVEPLWILFVNKQGQSLGAWCCLKPNRIIWRRGAYGVIETTAMPQEKRRQVQAALLHPGWLAHTRHWAVGCFGQKYYEK